MARVMLRRGLMKSAKIISLTLLVLSLFATVGAAQTLSTSEQSTLAGGVLGAGSGAIIGAAVGHPLAGAAIGGGVGVVTGAAIGNQLQSQEITEYRARRAVIQHQSEIDRQRAEIEQLKREANTE